MKRKVKQKKKKENLKNLKKGAVVFLGVSKTPSRRSLP